MVSAEYVRSVLDYDKNSGLFTWRVTRSVRAPAGSIAGAVCRGYVQIQIDRRIYRAHRLAWLVTYGVWPKGSIDHIDGNPGNNRITNLRDVPQQINTRNIKLSRNNKSGVNGVSWNAKAQKWQSHIMIDGKSYNLGSYHTVEDAAAARAFAEGGLGFINRPG